MNQLCLEWGLMELGLVTLTTVPELHVLMGLCWQGTLQGCCCVVGSTTMWVIGPKVQACESNARCCLLQRPG